MPAPETLRLHDDGRIPNSRLPVLVYRGVDAAGDAASCESLFARHGWLGAWRNGIFSYHHFHSTAHEVLGVVAGRASVALGGPQGSVVEVARGDVLVLPAGTGHCNAGASDDCWSSGPTPTGWTGTSGAGIPASATRCWPICGLSRCRMPTRSPGARSGNERADHRGRLFQELDVAKTQATSRSFWASASDWSFLSD